MSDERFDWYGESDEEPTIVHGHRSVFEDDEDAGPPVVLRVVLGLALCTLIVAASYAVALFLL